MAKNNDLYMGISKIIILSIGDVAAYTNYTMCHTRSAKLAITAIFVATIAEIGSTVADHFDNITKTK